MPTTVINVSYIPLHPTTAVIHLQPLIYPLCLHTTTTHPLIARMFQGMSTTVYGNCATSQHGKNVTLVSTLAYL